MARVDFALRPVAESTAQAPLGMALLSITLDFTGQHY
jgi:hypothetical protein